MHRLALLLFAIVLPAEVDAAPLPHSEEFEASERAAAMQAMLVYEQTGNPARIQQFDKFLENVKGPTKARGTIQMFRGILLSRLSRESEAQLAIQESIRLLPDYSAPLFTASYIFTYGPNPGAAADYFIRGSRIDPEVAAKAPTYDVFNILRRLRHANDQARVEALTDRLVQINWVGTDMDGRSTLIRDAILMKLHRKDVTGARSLVTELVDPSAHYALLAQRVADPIWSDIEAWSGPRLEKQWPVYLREAKRRFDASNDLENAGDYLQALVEARRDREAVAIFLPVFMSEERDQDDDALLLKTVTLAGALGRLGRFAEQDELYAHLGKIWPLGATTNALNLTANHAYWLMIRGENERSLALIDATITAAVKAGDEVNGDALAAMHQVRACVLVRSGRGSEAAASTLQGELGFSVAPARVAKMHLCLGRTDKAKNFVLQALSSEQTRTSMLLALQPDNLPAAKTALAETERAAWNRLRIDRDVLAALKSFGRPLSFAVGEGAPAALPD